MLKVGLTGGIGSGKSYISKIFNTLNVPVYNSDDSAKRLMVESADLRNDLIKLFGTQAYSEGQLNRGYIAERVFKDKKLLSALNNIVHPAVHNDFLLWSSEQTGNPYVIKEAAILFETGGYQLMDWNILIVADELTRIQRVRERDNVSEESVRDRMNNQMSDEEKISLADYVIYNNNDSMILQQIVDLHHQILKNNR